MVEKYEFRKMHHYAGFLQIGSQMNMVNVQRIFKPGTFWAEHINTHTMHGDTSYRKEP